ncbi:MAG: GerMN domain-containing protein [Coprobacillus sp.]
MKKRIIITSVLIVCLTMVGYSYLKKETNSSVEGDYIKNVVFKDKDNDLIPISVNLHSQVELEQEVRNRIDIMKSEEFERYGLYPVLSASLQVQSVQLKDKVLTISFNDELYSSKNDLDILETLAYTMTDYADVQQLKLQIDEKDVSYLPNSTIPISSLTKELGLNNFEETSTVLHETIPVMVYEEKTIQQYSYYVPTTIRLDEKDSIKDQVQTILGQIQGKIHLIDAKIDNGVLTVELGSNILLDNEKLDQKLEDLIILSLSSLKDVKDVEIKINGDDIKTKKSSQIEYNYIKI